MKKNRTEMVFDFIVQYMRGSAGIPPTVREIGAGVGLRSTNSVVFHLRKLEDAGRITIWGKAINATRAIQVVGASWHYEHLKEPALTLGWRCKCRVPRQVIEVLETQYNIQGLGKEFCETCRTWRPERKENDN